jgi:hypothetical protein
LPGEELITCSTSAVAVCCSSASRVSRLGQQPRILHRDDSLRREVLQQRYLFISERSYFPAIDRDKTEQTIVFTERHGNVAANTADPPQDLHSRRAGETGVLRYVRSVNNILAAKQPVSHAPRWWYNRFAAAKSFQQLDRGPAEGAAVQPFPIPSKQRTIARFAKLERPI